VTDPSADHNARRTRVLVADDTESVRMLFMKLLSADGHDVVVVQDGAQAIEAAQTHQPDVILLDITMPQLDGFAVCRRLKSDPAFRRTQVVLVTGLSDMSDRIKGLEVGADDFLSKPVHPHELRARVRSLLLVKRLKDEVDAGEAAFTALALAVEARDVQAVGRGDRVARLAERLGSSLGLPHEDLTALRKGGYLHDVGNVGVPEAVLLNAARLTPEEFDLVTRHPEIGEQLCPRLESLRRVRPIIRAHHERLDGSGYPGRLQGNAIPVLAQLVGIADVYAALTSPRPFRPALTMDQAAAQLRSEMQQGKFERRFVEAFLDVMLSEAAAVPVRLGGQ
jgi:putative two-component system response regulator